MISRSDWIMPAECFDWNNQLCYELGLEREFWVPSRPGERLSLTRRQRSALTLMIMKLRIRYLWGRDQIALAFGLKMNGTLAKYYERGDLLLEYIPELERCFTKLEGDQAVEFMMDYWGDLFAELFEISEGVSAE